MNLTRPVFILCIMALLAYEGAFASTSSQPNLSQQNLSQQNKNATFEYLIDETGSKTLDDVRIASSAFAESEANHLDLGIVRGATWIKLSLQASDADQKRQYLYLDKVQLRDIQFYQLVDNTITRQVTTGTNFPFQSRDVAIAQWAFVLAPTNTAQTVYLRLDTRSPLQTSVNVVSASELLAQANRHTVFYSLILGFFGFLCIVAVTLGVVVQRKEIWVGSLIMIAALVEILSSSGIGFAFIWPNSPNLNPVFTRASLTVALGATGLFCAEFLKVTSFAPKLARITQIASGALILSTLMPIVSVAPSLFLTLVAVVPCCILYCIIQSLRQGISGTGLVLAGFTVFLATVAAAILATMQMLPLSIKYELLFDVGLVAMAFLMAISLATRISGQALESAANEHGIKAKSLFFASVSHELRTPISGVIGMLNLMMKDNLSEPQQRLAFHAKSSAESLLLLINDILDFSKIEAGKLEVEPLEFDIVDLLEEVVESFACLDVNKHLTFVLNTAKIKHTKIVSDPSRIRQILNNLISNAAKFTDQGEIEIKAKLVGTQGEEKLRLSVRDTGIGISAEQLPKLFADFTQADQSTSRKYGGTGLGLSIAKQLSELLGGELVAKSQPKVGSTFTLTIDVVTSNIDTVEAPSPLEGKTVLLFSHNLTARSTAGLYLERWGADVMVATSMKEFLKILLLKQPDIALCCEAPEKLDRMSSPVKQTGKSSPYALPLDSPITAGRLARQVLTQKPAAKNPDNNSEPDAKPFKLLLVEDNFINTEVAMGILEDDGYHDISHAENGQDALEKLKAEKYDLVLMDCQMPVIDGYEATQRIRDGRGGQQIDIPIIAMTANAMQGDKEKCLEAGMSDYITKPINPEKLSYTLENWLRH